MRHNHPGGDLAPTATHGSRDGGRRWAQRRDRRGGDDDAVCRYDDERESGGPPERESRGCAGHRRSGRGSQDVAGSDCCCRSSDGRPEKSAEYFERCEWLVRWPDGRRVGPRWFKRGELHKTEGLVREAENEWLNGRWWKANVLRCSGQ